MFDYQRKILEVLLKKCRITVKLYEAYHAKDMEKLAELRDVLILLREKVIMLRLEYAAKRIENYINGRIDRIEELEETHLRFTNHTVNHEEDFVYDQIYSHVAFII